MAQILPLGGDKNGIPGIGISKRKTAKQQDVQGIVTMEEPGAEYPVEQMRGQVGVGQVVKEFENKAKEIGCKKEPRQIF